MGKNQSTLKCKPTPVPVLSYPDKIVVRQMNMLKHLNLTTQQYEKEVKPTYHPVSFVQQLNTNLICSYAWSKTETQSMQIHNADLKLVCSVQDSPRHHFSDNSLYLISDANKYVFILLNSDESNYCIVTMDKDGENIQKFEKKIIIRKDEQKYINDVAMYGTWRDTFYGIVMLGKLLIFRNDSVMCIDETGYSIDTYDYLTPMMHILRLSEITRIDENKVAGILSNKEFTEIIIIDLSNPEAKQIKTSVIRTTKFKSVYEKYGIKFRVDKNEQRVYLELTDHTALDYVYFGGAHCMKYSYIFNSQYFLAIDDIDKIDYDYHSFNQYLYDQKTKKMYVVKSYEWSKFISIEIWDFQDDKWIMILEDTVLLNERTPGEEFSFTQGMVTVEPLNTNHPRLMLSHSHLIINRGCNLLSICKYTLKPIHIMNMCDDKGHHLYNYESLCCYDEYATWTENIVNMLGSLLNFNKSLLKIIVSYID